MEENTIEQFVKQVKEGDKNVIDVSKKVLEGGKEVVTVELTKRKVMPDRMESPARAHVFHVAPGFIAYIEENKTDNTIVMANVSNTHIFAVLDDKAKLGFETIALNPPYDARFELLQKTLLGKQLPIDAFARHVMRNRPIIIDSADMTAKDLAMAMQQITISSETVQGMGVGKKAVNGLMCKTTIAAGTEEAPVELPDSFEVEVPIFLGTDPVKFGVDVTITTQSGQVWATVDAPEIEVKKFEVFEQILEPIKAIDGVLVSYGWPNTDDWKYNK